MVTIVIPALLLVTTGGIGAAWPLQASLRLTACLPGIVLTVSGLVLLVTSMALFAAVGKGTLSPWDPAQRLVAEEIYRHVRNPMISGACMFLLGEALATRSTPLFGWFVVFVLSSRLYIPRVEEHHRERRVGRECIVYQTQVSRWLPRLRPWKVAADMSGEGTLELPSPGPECGSS